MKTLIIGQGLAGTILAFKLLQKGNSITDIVDNNQQKASLKAGGMVNPIVFRQMTKSWLIDDLYPEFLQTSKELEEFLSQKFFYPTPIQRFFGAGIRPTTHDRRPVFGFLKNQPTIGILNGLASKGLLLAPWSANQLTQKMENNNFQIHPEVDVEKYFKGD